MRRCIPTQTGELKATEQKQKVSVRVTEIFRLRDARPRKERWGYREVEREGRRHYVCVQAFVCDR